MGRIDTLLEVWGLLGSESIKLEPVFTVEAMLIEIVEFEDQTLVVGWERGLLVLREDADVIHRFRDIEDAVDYVIEWVCAGHGQPSSL